MRCLLFFVGAKNDVLSRILIGGTPGGFAIAMDTTNSILYFVDRASCNDSC
jgi:hypothetical protein